MGVPSVVAAGNDFDTRGYGSISSPGTSAAAITVAATSTTSVFGVAGTASGSKTPRSRRSSRCRRSGRASRAALTQPTPLVGPEAYGLDRRACREPRRRRALRAVVIVLRGGCGFAAKAINAHEAGAQAVIVESDRPGPPFVVEEQADIPLLVVTDVVGSRLRGYIASAGIGARVRFTRAIAAAADAAARAHGLLVRGPDALRSAAQARHRGPGRGDPLVGPARLDRLPRRIRLMGGHVDGRARR